MHIKYDYFFFVEGCPELKIVSCLNVAQVYHIHIKYGTFQFFLESHELFELEVAPLSYLGGEGQPIVAIGPLRQGQLLDLKELTAFGMEQQHILVEADWLANEGPNALEIRGNVLVEEGELVKQFVRAEGILVGALLLFYRFSKILKFFKHFIFSSILNGREDLEIALVKF